MQQQDRCLKRQRRLQINQNIFCLRFLHSLNFSYVYHTRVDPWIDKIQSQVVRVMFQRQKF